MASRKKSTRKPISKARATSRSGHPIPPLAECVQHSVEAYFTQLDGHRAREVYELVLSEIEPPLLAATLQVSNGNLSKAADMLGLSRATLRTKLKKYRLHAK